MNTSTNPLQNATHMLEQRQAFQAWTQTDSPRSHQKWLGSRSWILSTCSAILGGSAFLGGMFLFWLGMHSRSNFLTLVGITLSLIIATSFISASSDVSIFHNIFHNFLNKHSKKFGVWFARESGRTLWGPYPQEKKTQLLSILAQLGESWAPIKAEVLSLINSDLPYVWWQQMEHEVRSGLDQECKANAQQRQDDEFLQAQTQVQSQIQPTLDVKVENEREPVKTPVEKTSNILL